MWFLLLQPQQQCIHKTCFTFFCCCCCCCCLLSEVTTTKSTTTTTAPAATSRLHTLSAAAVLSPPPPYSLSLSLSFRSLSAQLSGLLRCFDTVGGHNVGASERQRLLAALHCVYSFLSFGCGDKITTTTTTALQCRAHIL